MSGRNRRVSSRPPPQSEDVFTRSLVDAQTTQLEIIMLQQRLAEIRSQAPLIAKRLDMLRKRAAAQRQMVGKMTAFRAAQQATNARKAARKNLENAVFRQNVQNGFEMTNKERGWQRIQRKIDSRRKQLLRRKRI